MRARPPWNGSETLGRQGQDGNDMTGMFNYSTQHRLMLETEWRQDVSRQRDGTVTMTSCWAGDNDGLGYAFSLFWFWVLTLLYSNVRCCRMRWHLECLMILSLHQHILSLAWNETWWRGHLSANHHNHVFLSPAFSCFIYLWSEDK